MPFLSLGYPNSCFPFACCTCCVVVHVPAAAGPWWAGEQWWRWGWQHLQCPTFHESRLCEPSQAAEAKGAQFPDALMMARQLFRLGACTQSSSLLVPEGGSAALCGFGNSGAATTWGESEGQKHRGEAPYTSLPRVNRWCLRSSTKLHLSKAANILSYWLHDDGLKNVMGIKYFYILVFHCCLTLRKVIKPLFY